MKKILSILLTLAMIVSFAGCSSNSSGPSEEGAPTGAVSETPAVSSPADSSAADTSADEPSTIDIWCWDAAFNVYAIKQAAELYNADHPNVTFNIEDISDINLKLVPAVTSQQWDLLPDILLTQDRDMAKNVKLYDIYEDLTDCGIDFSQFAPYKDEAATVNGKIYGVPFDNGVACYVYRSDLLQQAGFTADDLTDITWADFMKVGEAVKEKLGIPMAKVRTDAGFTLIEMMMESAGTWYFNEGGELDIADNDVFREALDLYLEMVDKGIVVEVSDGEQYSSAFYDGSVLGTVNASWVLATVSKEEALSGKWSITNIPKLIKAPNATNYSSSGGCSWTVINKSKNVDGAIDFLKQTVGGGTYANEFYDRILDGATVIASYLPLTDSDAYNKKIDYFGGQTIYKDLVDYSANVPKISLGSYTSEARAALATCVQQIHSGTDIDTALADMKATLDFQMGN